MLRWFGAYLQKQNGPEGPGKKNSNNEINEEHNVEMAAGYGFVPDVRRL